MIRYSLKQLSYFVAVAEGGSTLRAAQTLNVSQPAVSMAINQLEQMFENKLFVRRHAQGVELTPFGRRKLVDARHLLVRAEALSAKDGDAIQGDLEIGIFETLAPNLLPGILSKLKKKFPKINVRARERNLDEIYRDLKAGLIELAVLYDLDLWQDMTTIELGSFAPYVLLPAKHPLAEHESISLRDVAREPYVLIDMPYSRDYFLSLFRMTSSSPETVIRCASLESVRGMVAHGHGLSTLVTRPASNVSYDGKRLACRPIREKVSPQRCIIAYPPRIPLTPVAQIFVDICREHVSLMTQDRARHR